MKELSRMYPLGIRIQLMLWYSVVFAALTLLSSILFYARFQVTLARSLDTALQLQAQQIAGDIVPNPDGTLTFQDATAELPGFDPRHQQQYLPPADVDLDILVRVLTANGRPFRTTPAFRTLVVPSESVTRPLHGVPWQGEVTTTTGQRVRLYSRALIVDGKLAGVIQVGTSLSQVNTTLHDVGIELLLIAPFILLLSAGVSYWLAARAFVPIDRLTQAARHIKAGDLRQRVPVPRAHDEIRRLALTLNEMIDHLEQAFLRQRRFVADASHELRTPVTAIRSKTDMALLQVFSPEEYLSIFGTIHAEAERLGRLISDLLALARADEGQVHLEREVVRFDLLVEAVVATVEPLAVEQGITLEVKAAEPIVVQGDEARLMQVVLNLLENAIHYTNRGGQVLVTVQAKKAQAYLMVRDTGIGIAADHLPYIFDRFYRIDPARTHTEGGHSGLGLSIVDWIVKAHNGSIAVESQLGHGSTFIVLLPLHTVE
jgi:two-component system OmpR family sensor kinase